MNSAPNNQAVHVCHKWVIKRLSSRDDEEIYSNEFSPYEDTETTWDLKMVPHKEDGFVSVYLRSKSSSNEAVASFSLALKNTIGASIENRSSSRKRTFSKEDDSWGWENFVKREVVIDKIKDHDDTLMVICEVNFETKQPAKNQVSCCQTSSLNYFESLVNDPDFSDVILESSGAEEIHAHKTILSAVSPVFKRMFISNMSEKETNRVLISDIDHETLLRLLTFMYCCEMPKVDDLSDIERVNLLAAAHKYDIPSLESILEEYLTPNISRSNVVDLLTASYLYDRSKLKESAIKFICSQKDDYIIETPEWSNLATKYPELLNECFKFMFFLQKKTASVSVTE